MKAIGAMIKEELERQERTAGWLAAKLSCHRTNVYNILSRNDIDLSLLVRISKILHRNFLKDIGNEINDEVSL